jgi:hypothetical protein
MRAYRRAALRSRSVYRLHKEALEHALKAAKHTALANAFSKLIDSTGSGAPLVQFDFISPTTFQAQSGRRSADCNSSAAKRSGASVGVAPGRQTELYRRLQALHTDMKGRHLAEAQSHTQGGASLQPQPQGLAGGGGSGARAEAPEPKSWACRIT